MMNPLKSLQNSNLLQSIVALRMTSSANKLKSNKTIYNAISSKDFFLRKQISSIHQYSRELYFWKSFRNLFCSLNQCCRYFRSFCIVNECLRKNSFLGNEVSKVNGIKLF